jgi:ADP-ribose pyrophosphatase YjhB (NUDIX family)
MSSRYPPRPVVAVGVLLLHEGSVLLVQRARPPQVGRWTVPGGKVELGESLEAAALRELVEETGLGCTLGPVVEVLDRVVRDAEGRIEFHYVILDFLGTSPTGTLQAGDDSSDARFVPIEALGSYDLTDGLERVVRHAEALRQSGAQTAYRERAELTSSGSPDGAAGA